MFVLIDIPTMKARVIVWSVDKARLLPASNVRMIAALPASLAEDLINGKVSAAVMFAGITEWATRNA